MNQTLDVVCSLTGLRRGRPPKRDLILDVQVTNPFAEPRWCVMGPDCTGASPPRGTWRVEVSAYAGHDDQLGPVLVGRFFGTWSAHVLLLSPKAQVRLRHLTITSWDDADTLPFGVSLAREINLGGEPIGSWFPQGTEPVGTADVGRPVDLVHAHQTPDLKELAVTLQDVSARLVTIELHPSHG